MLKINKLVKYKEHEYAFIIGNEPMQYCDICDFNKICSKVLSKELSLEDSPMKMCMDLCEKENVNFAMFIKSNEAESFCKSINKKY